jgi:hypothetical protein
MIKIMDAPIGPGYLPPMKKLFHILMTLCLLATSVVGMAHMSGPASALPMVAVGMSDGAMEQMMADCDDCTATPAVSDTCDIICAVPAVIARKEPLAKVFLVAGIYILPVAHLANGITRRPEIAPPRLLS